MKAQKIFYFSFLFTIHFIFGQNYQELQKLQEEYKKALERQSLSQPAEISNAEQTIKSASLPDKLIYSRKDIESLLVNTEKLLLKLKFLEDTTNKMPYVGYDFFTKRDSIPFWQNLPISKDYTLGPGDEIIISMWGESNSLLTEVINRDGQIFVEKIGILNLGGKSLNEAKKHIISKYSKVYSTLVSPTPKSYIDLTLGELKSINVHFVGFVNIPGVHMVHPFSNVISGLIQAGGVDNMGTLRDIQIIRNDEILDKVDLYDYLISGKSFNTTRLLDQDIIHVPPRYSTIPITGRVLRPGYYESLINENLEDLIGFSGGRNSKSSNHIFLYKDEKGTNNGFIVEYNKRSNFLINQGDSIHIPITNFNYSYVQIQGRIKNPGKYPFNSEMRIKNLIESTNSLDDEDFYRTMDLSRILVFRKNPDDQNPIKILTDIKKNIFLKSGDHITIPRNPIMSPIESVIITGEIKTPGIYPVNSLTTLSDILSLSGGLNDNALEDGIEIFRDSLKIGWEKQNFILKDGDSLNVMKKTGLVFVDGEVNSPGFISYKSNQSLKKYIKKAGGFTSFADINNIYVTYPNGTSSSISSLIKPKIKDGSIIYINQRTISGQSEMSGWQIFAMISSQAGSIATTLVSLSLLMSQN